MAVSTHNVPNASLPLHDSPSHPSSQVNSPSSPTASFIAQQQAYSSARSNSSRSSHPSLPSTPTTLTHESSLLDPPPTISYACFMQTWSDAHVSCWLSDNKVGHLAQVFKMNDIRGDVLLDLNQATLREMGINSVGERIRIVNALKSLRQKCAQSGTQKHRLSIHSERDDPTAQETSLSRLDSGRRLEAGRPAPLQLISSSSLSDLPRLVRDGQDFARPDSSRVESSKATASSARPLPQPNGTTTPHVNTPHSSHLYSTRPNLPPLPPPPRGQPPLPPGRPPTGSGSQSNDRKTPPTDDPITHQNPPFSAVSHGLLTPNGPGNWSAYGLPSDPRPSHRTPTGPGFPLSSQRLPIPGRAHGRNTSLSSLNPNSPAKLPPRPSTGQGYPFATPVQASSLASAQQLANLSPIAESFNYSSSPSPPATINSYRVGSGPFSQPNAPPVTTPTLDDLKRKLVRFQLPQAGQSCTINAEECAGGIEILEKALKKLKVGTKSYDREGHVDYVSSDEGGLSVDGWGVYLDWGQTGKPLTEAQLLAFCHSPPDDPVRGHLLTVRRISRGKRSKPLHQIFGEDPPIPPTPSLVVEEDLDQLGSPRWDRSFATDQAELENVKRKKAKRASTISVLSGLGVPDPEKVLDSRPPSPTQKGPSKLRNFFGQRPPSELITNHLAEYFPNTEKKVLERTRRQSTLRASGLGPGRRDSAISWNPPATSRFSVSTMGSHRPVSTMSPRNSVLSLAPDRVSFSNQNEDATLVNAGYETPPRVSISTDAGSEVDTDAEDDEPSKRTSQLHLLPPVNLPSESLSESMTDLTGDGAQERPLSKTFSKRMSFITELRSKRDRSDIASLLTVDEITAEVESRRGSGKPEKESSDDWTQLDFEDESKHNSEVEGMEEVPFEPEDVPVVAVEETEGVENDGEGEYDEDEDENDGQEAEDELTDDEPGKAITSKQGETTIKWIKGALIGAGSFGQVYLGMDAGTGLLMAVKQVSLPTGTGLNQERKKSMLSALEREIELLRELQHENIVQYHTSCIDDEHLNIFLEYVPGGSVTALLRNYGAFEEPLVRNFVRQILQGLNYLHERDIIHRDIKGANILVDNKGGIKISDFGISKKVEDNLLHDSRAHRPSLQGSVYWMAPEVVKQTTYTRKADIWSVGCLVVEMLTGEHPWAQLSQMQAIFKIGSSAKPTIPSDISPEAENFLLLTFESNHEARPDASALLQHSWITGTKLDNVKSTAEGPC